MQWGMHGQVEVEIGGRVAFAGTNTVRKKYVLSGLERCGASAARFHVRHLWSTPELHNTESGMEESHAYSGSQSDAATTEYGVPSTK